MNSTKTEMLKYLRSLNINNNTGDWIELDNLDRAKLVSDKGLVRLENEHGTIFDLEELSDEELEAFFMNY